MSTTSSVFPSIYNSITSSILGSETPTEFSILDLFTGGQQGAWYAPSDLTTLYQTSTGTTPVTVDGQPVGLVLDKSRGLELGSELVTNGTFDSGTDGWVGGSGGELSNESGQLKVTNTGYNDYASQIVPVVINRTYLIKATLSSTSVFYGNTNNPKLGAYSSASDVSRYAAAFASQAGDTLSMYVTAIAANLTVRLDYYGPAGNFAVWDDVSVREVHGNHAIQPVAAARPTYNDTPDRLTLDKVDDAIIIDIPAGGWTGSMVLGTVDGTASYGVTIPAGEYTLGGTYFPSNTINNLLLRDGAVSASDLAKVEADFVKDGATASYGAVTDFTSYWRDMGEITSFPLIDTSSGTYFIATWYGNNLTSFPLIDTSSGTNFSFAWTNNSLTSFPLIDTSSGTSFIATWQNNTNLNTFPANMFDNCLAINFTNAFLNTGLSQSSIDGILVSINSNGTSNGTFDQSGGSAPSATGEAAITAMRSRGWTVTVTGGF